MSRRSRYGRAQHAAARPPRLESARPEAGNPRPQVPGPAPATAPAAAQAPSRNGHFTPEPTAALAPDVPAIESNGHAVPLIVAAPPSSAAAPSNGHAAIAPDAPGCTAPQLRRFIKSRTYVPMHELRRRFGINGTEDDVTPVDTEGRRIFVGLPPREGRLLGELLRAGDVGYELSMDPLTPVVVGVYPMRPVPRS
jgi:hypothetical protein